MTKSKETVIADNGQQQIEVAQGDMSKEQWEDYLARGAANGVRFLKKVAGGVAEQAVKMIPGVGAGLQAAESLGQLDALAKGEKPSDSTFTNAARGVTSAVTTAGDVAGAATGFGKEVAGHLNENPELVAEGKAQLQKNVSDLGLGGKEVPPPPPAYPGPEPVDVTQPVAEQPAPSTPTSQAAPAQRPALPKDFVKQQDDLTQAYNAVGNSAAAAKKAIDAGTEARTAALHEEERLNQEAEIIRLQRAQVQADIMAKAQQQRSEWMDRQNQLVELSRKAAEDPIDPNRYWNNKDVGQKVSAVIAGALFGFTGQGMQWLQRLDSLVAQDMQAQSADRASKVAGLERAAARAGSIADSAMKMGAEEAEARTLDKIAKMENIKARIDMLGRSSNNADVAAKAEMMKNQLDEKTLDSRMQLEKLREAKLARMAENDMRRAQLGMMAARQGAAGVQMDPEAVKKMTAKRDLLNTVEQMKELSADSGFLDRLRRLGAEKLSSEEKAKVRAYEALKFKGMKLMAESALSEHEQKALGGIFGDRTQLFESGKDRYDQVGKMVLGSLRSDFEAARVGKYGDVGALEQFLSGKEAKLSGKSAIPASAMEEVQ